MSNDDKNLPQLFKELRASESNATALEATRAALRHVGSEGTQHVDLLINALDDSMGYVRREAAALSLLPLAFYANYRYQYPYGMSHSCDKVLWTSLDQYAHGGAFPTGEATPEASLSLLYRSEWSVDTEILRGKTVSYDVVEAILARGELLSPETCGWHYVNGLRIDDDPKLAIFWDKIGLAHNGMRLAGGGHTVWFVDGSRKRITEADWSSFIATQANLLAARKLREPQ